jgi:hypothetical protein
MMHCSKCGKENSDSSKFCLSCGNQLGTSKQEASNTVKPQSKWKYNFWKDPNIEKPDKILAVVYIVGTLLFPISAVIWLIVIWFVRGRRLPLIFKQFISVGLILGAIGAWMAWHDANKAQTTAVQQGWFQQQ